MSNNNGPNTIPLFNNNKSLYASRSQANQSSKKILIIEDKTTLEPVRTTPASPSVNSTNINYQRSASVNITVPQELSLSQIRKQIQIQKQALNSFQLEQMHTNVYHQLDAWKCSMNNRIESMKNHALEENNHFCKERVQSQTKIIKLLEDTFIKQLLTMKNNPESINPEELDKIEEQLEQIKNEIELTKEFDLQFDTSNVDITGELQLNKMTDFSKHEPLPRPLPSPPPPASAAPQAQTRLSTPFKPQRSTPDQITTNHSSSPDRTEYKPTPPIWTEATQQGLNNLSHFLPFRLLIPEYVRKALVENFDIDQFEAMLQITCQSSCESILTILNQSTLNDSIEILNDLVTVFKYSSNQHEFRFLYQKRFIPILTGKRTERLERFREKYQLDMVKIFPQTCPQSDERVVLLRGQHAEYIIYCLREIIQNILEQAHFTDDDKQLSYAMYDPSINYDESSAHEYGGYKPNDICEIKETNETNIISSENLTETKHQSTVSIHSSSSSSLSKQRNNSDVPLNYDDTELESDDKDDEFKRSKSSDDTRIFVKKLTCVKGRQVGLLIGPFGQHITQIREQTGAKIHLTNDDNEPSVIKGTKSQIKDALRLIKECLQTQKPIPRTAYKGGRRR